MNKKIIALVQYGFPDTWENLVDIIFSDAYSADDLTDWLHYCQECYLSGKEPDFESFFSNIKAD